MNNETILKKVSYLETFQVDDFINQLLSTSDAISVGFLNQHGYNLVVNSPSIKADFLSLDYILRDGIGIKLACKLSKINPGANLNGTDLIPRIIEQSQAYSQPVNYLCYGTIEPWLSRGASKLFKQSPFNCLDGFQNDDDYLEHFRAHLDKSALNIVVLAMGMPKQERIAKMLTQTIGARVLVICGGAILDFQAQRVSRAPEFYQKNGLEWVYRLLKEPKRMFSRYVIGIPIFFANVAMKK
ncbi:WecB/TagA/CpsF family glycosyltransferase [Shewanella olleyana]|uniref:WecB/TagA/CpsF family glycosyltransferase n=1 Tax=Shewanella olleyana TaxID=135626 RepID=UPI00200E9F1B|nr:WecB/TagA/CpsF family glycosyltransferase [Shewanella olleyana]MCL1065351.1 WecB/TagA/CpsF family glycosyltransferase [Shewanella olleyana]